MTKTFASLFTGGGGADVSARKLGYSHLWGIELDPKIASVAEMNGFSTMVADVCTVDFSSMTTPDWLHMSPPCTRASRANANATESELDQHLADACNRAIEALQPRRVSLENVWGYRDFAAFRSILACLTRNGYAVDYWHLNAADYGIPQTRKRLCLVASKDHTPRRPAVTHTERLPHIDQAMMFNALPPWVGWHTAIADLIPSLPDSAFAPWQLERLPADLSQSMILTNQAFDGLCTAVPAGQPWATVVLPKSTGGWRAFVVDCQESGSTSGLTVREAADPMYTLSATMEPRRPARAYVGRVVKMTPRALARFNGLTDDYLLPPNNTLACTVLGNMHILQGPMIEANL